MRHACCGWLPMWAAQVFWSSCGGGGTSVRAHDDRVFSPDLYPVASSQVGVRAPSGARGIEAGVGTDPVTCFSDGET